MDEIGGWTQVAPGIGLESQQMEFWQMALRVDRRPSLSHDRTTPTALIYLAS
jgi:hypothetical protein